MHATQTNNRVKLIVVKGLGESIWTKSDSSQPRPKDDLSRPRLKIDMSLLGLQVGLSRFRTKIDLNWSKLKV